MQLSIRKLLKRHTLRRLVGILMASAIAFAASGSLAQRIGDEANDSSTPEMSQGEDQWGELESGPYPIETGEVTCGNDLADSANAYLLYEDINGEFWTTYRSTEGGCGPCAGTPPAVFDLEASDCHSECARESCVSGEPDTHRVCPAFGVGVDDGGVSPGPQGPAARTGGVVDTSILRCRGYQKGHPLWGWFSSHDFLMVGGIGYGKYEKNLNVCGTGVIKNTDHWTYPNVNPATLPNGAFYSVCTPVRVNSCCIDVAVFEAEVATLVTTAMTNPCSYCAVGHSCREFCHWTITTALDAARRPECDYDWKANPGDRGRAKW